MEITLEELKSINKQFEKLNEISLKSKVGKKRRSKLIDKVRDILNSNRINNHDWDYDLLKLAIDANSMCVENWYPIKIINLNKAAFELLVSDLFFYDTAFIETDLNHPAFMCQAAFNNDIEKVEVLIKYDQLCSSDDICCAINTANECGYTDIVKLIDDTYERLNYDEDDEEYCFNS